MTAHEDFSRRQEIKTGSDRGFGVVFALVFAAVGLWPSLADGAAPRLWALIVAAAFLAVALFRPVLLAPFNRLWSRLGLVLSRIVNPLVLGVLFYLVVTPTALAFRVFGKDPLRLRRGPEEKSYWIERSPPGPPPDSMSNQF